VRVPFGASGKDGCVIAGLVDWILSLHGPVAVGVVFLIPALEASAFVGFVFPGEIAVLLGGVLAYQGRIPLWAAIAAAIAGAILGDSIGYWIGREYGRRILTTIGRRLPIVGRRVDEHLDGAEAYVRRRGASAVFFGRFTAALRVMVPGLAGMARIPYGEFALFNALGGAVWGAAFALLGFVAGAAWEQVAGVASRVGLALLAVVLLLLIGGRVLKVWRRAEAAKRGPVAAARRRWPRQTRWVERRFVPSSPRGFPLSVTVAGGAACVWVFAAMTQDVLAHEEAVRLDPRALRFGLEHRTAAATAAMKAVTVLGSNWVLVPLALVVGALVSWRRHAWRPLVELGSTAAGAVLLYEGFKQWVGRARPPASVRLVPVSGFAFPSGHATQVAAVLLMLTVVLTSRRSLRSRVLVAAVAAVVVLAVGVSRIYLGVHWLTDVVGGWTLGGAWACSILAIDLGTTTEDEDDRSAREPDGHADESRGRLP
jgi:membrane protein DedA with SNARE-associated domain/membrane-associated phospholipid phosphatase